MYLDVEGWRRVANIIRIEWCFLLDQKHLKKISILHVMGGDKGCIYVFTNKINGMRYVGQTWNIQRRIKDHRSGRGCARLLKEAIEVYGMGNFSVRIIYHSTEQASLDRVERLLIQICNAKTPTGYNIALGGSKGKHSEQTKKLIGSYHVNKVVTEETRRKISDALHGKRLELSHIDNLRRAVIKSHKDKDRPIYFYNCITHLRHAQFRNMHHVKNNVEFPITRVYGSLSKKSACLVTLNYSRTRTTLLKLHQSLRSPILTNSRKWCLHQHLPAILIWSRSQTTSCRKCTL